MAEPEEMAPAETGGGDGGDGEAPVGRRRSWGRYIVTRAAAGLLGLVLLLVLAVFLIDTGPGHRFIADRIQGLKFQNGMQISVGRIEGSIYGDMVLHDLSVKDPKGEFLFSPEVHVDWRPLGLIHNHVDVRSATAQRIVLRRTPQLRPTRSTGPLLPNIDIDIGKLRIDRLVLEPPVTGSQRTLAVAGEAHIANGRAQLRLAANTVAGQSGAGGDKLALVLDAVPEKNRLAIDLKLNAPADGAVASLAGLDKALAVRIDGKGDWQDWNGSVDANLGNGELARLALTARAGTFRLKGPTRVARLFSGPTAQLLGPVLDVDLGAALDQRRADLSGGVHSDGFRLGAKGTVDLANNRFDGLQLAVLLGKPSAIAPNLSGSGIHAALRLDGAFARPGVRYSIEASHLVANGIGLEGFTASGAARTEADQMIVPVQARAARITGLDTVAGGTLVNVRLAGDVAVKGPRLVSDNLRLTSDRIKATALVVADMSTGLYTGALNGTVGHYRVEGVGVFNVELNGKLRSTRPGLVLNGKVRARSTELLNDNLKTLLGGNAVAAADVNYGMNGVIHLSNLQVVAPDFHMTGGTGSYAPDGRIALDASAVSQQYGKLAVQVSGTIANPQAHLTAEHPGLGIGLAKLEASVTGAGNGYRLQLTAGTDYGPLKADVTLGTRGQTSLQINSADFAGVTFAGSLTKTAAGPFAGELTAKGNGLGGIVRLSDLGGRQQALVNLRANDTVFDGPARLRIGSAIVDAKIVLYDQPLVVADAQVSRARYGGFALNAARVKVDYRNGEGKAQAMIEGTRGAPFRLAVNADLTPRLWRVALTGRMRGVELATAAPARIVPGKGSYQLLPTTLTVGGGKLRLAGTYGSGMELQARLESIDVALSDSFAPGLGIGGSASGSLDFVQSDPSAFPRADARLQIANFTHTTSLAVSQPVDVDFAGKLQADGGVARAVFRRSGTVIGRLAATLRPLGPAAGSWTQRLMQAPLGGGVRYNGPADTLFSFAGQAGQELSGPIALAADFSCKITSPCINGIVRAKGLTYENATYGTRLTNLDLSGRFTGDRLQIESMSADAGDGTLSGQGYVSLAAASGYPMDVSVKLDNARLARSDAISARATGQLHLTKSAGETPLLSGTLRLPETRYKIIREGAAQVPQLTGVRFKPRHGREPITGEEQAQQITSVFGKIRLDIALVAPERLYVSGMGLDSEWKANLKVAGTSAAPTLTGTVSLVRGNLGFAGHSFDLSEGTISFNDGRTIDPSIRLVATDDIEDVTVNVNVTGRSSNPQIAFTSTPSLPQDEIMSRVLFGSSIGNLSAIQAVQLAASLNSLRGSGGGLNPLGKLRSAVGVDRLRILGPDQATGRGDAIAAGQYITNDIYVELITDARGFTAAQLEVSLTPWLSVLSQAGGSGTNSASVRIKKNY